MKTIKFFYLLLTLIPLSGITQPCQVTFYVQDAETKKAIKGAAIHIDENKFITKNTLDDGKAFFTETSAGKIHYSVAKEGYIPVENEGVNVICNSKTDNFKVSLRKLPPPSMVTIFGKIKSQKQIELKTAKVNVNIAGKIWPSNVDENGNYALEIPEKDMKEKVFTIEVIQNDCPTSPIQQEIPKDNVIKIDIEICAEERGLSVIREEINANFSELSGLIGSIEMSTLSNVMMKMPGETEREFQAKAKKFRSTERDLAKQAFDKFRVRTETFSAHQLGIKDEKLLSNIRNVYQKQKDAVDAAFGYIEALNHLLSLDKPDDVFCREALCKHLEKVIDAKINLVDAAGLYCYTLKDSSDVEIVKLYLRLAKLVFKATNQQRFYQESRTIIAGFYQQKAENIAKCAGLKITPSTSNTNISIEDINRHIDTIFAPPKENPFQIKIDSSIKDPEKLLVAGTMAYLSNDSRATRYYYQIGLQNDTAAEHFKRYFALSIERLDNAEIYDGGLGMMILKITPKNGFDKAGLRRFDVISSINGKIIKTPKDISDDLIQRDKQDSLIEYWRDGKKRSAIIKTGQQGGGIVVPLIVCEPVQL